MKSNLIEIELGSTVKEAIQLLENHHGEKIMDEIALVLYDDDYEEIFYADCMDISGHIEDIEDNIITEVEKDYDFYGDAFNRDKDERVIKKAYRIKTKKV